MSRQATQAGGALARSYTLSLKLLAMIAFPLTVLTTFAAPFLVGVLGGAEFLPAGAVALAVMVWSMPFGWINSVTNYALIAVDQQRALTRAFVVGLTFNVAANLIMIPRFSYLGAAVVTIFSEIVEGAAFYVYVRRHITPVRWADVLGRPALAAGAMALTTWVWASGGATGVGLLYGLLAYGATLWLTGALAPGEWAMLAPLLPARLRKAPPAPGPGGA
jgi:O-antigen/teichoic acid export membrane protein